MTPITETDRRTVLKTTGALLAGVGLAGCSSSEGQPGDGDEPDGPTVEVGPNDEFVFTPGTEEPLTVESGTTVTFVWKSNTHNVVVNSQPDGANWEGHEPIENDGFSTEFTFETPGTYEYVCEPHETLGMVGTVVVE